MEKVTVQMCDLLGDGHHLTQGSLEGGVRCCALCKLLL